MHQPEPLMAEGLPAAAAAAAAAPGIMGLPANSSPAKGEYLQKYNFIIFCSGALKSLICNNS